MADEAEWEDVEWEDVDEPAPAPVDDKSRISKLLSDYRSMRASDEDERNRSSDSFYTAALTAIPKMLGVRQDLGQLGAGIVDKAFGSNKPFGDLVQDSKPDIERFYREKEKEVLPTMIGQGLGSSVVQPFGAASSAIKAAPFASKLISAGATGLDSALQSGLLGYQDSQAADTEGKAYDALSQALLGGLAGTTMSLAPEALKSAYGMARNAPRRGLDALAEWLGPKPATAPASRADDFAGQMADAAHSPASDNVVPMPVRNKEDEITQRMPFWRRLLQDEYGGSGGKLAPDAPPMEADTAITPVPPPGPRGPDVKHKGLYRGQQHRFPNDLKKIGNSEAMDMSLDPEAAAVFHDRTKPGGTLDDMLFSDPSSAEERAWEMLDAGPMGASKNRQAWDVDSKMGNYAAAPEEVTGNAIAGRRAADLRGPLAEDHTRIMDYGETQRWLKDLGYDDAGNPFRSQEDIERVMSETNKLGARNLASAPREPISMPPPDRAASQAQATAPWDDEAIAAARAQGMKRLEQIGGKVGSVAGAVGGFQAGGPLGALGGWSAGGRAGERAVQTADKFASWLAKNPARLTDIEAQGGELGRAAGFVLQGARERGEQGLKARSYILAAMPQFREWFAGNVDER